MQNEPAVVGKFIFSNQTYFNVDLPGNQLFGPEEQLLWQEHFLMNMNCFVKLLLFLHLNFTFMVLVDFGVQHLELKK